jgi:hypothetical protein
MKHFFILLSFFIWYNGYSQGIVVEHTQTEDVEAKIDYALAALSMSPVTSGVLLDRTIPLFNSTIIGSSTSADFVWMSYRTMSLAYHSIYAARIPGNSTLPSPEDAYAAAFGAYTASATVLVVPSALEYQKFEPDAIDDGHLVISGGQLHYGSGGSPELAGRQYLNDIGNHYRYELLLLK